MDFLAGHWVALAIIARLFWACTNVVDQYIARAFGSRRIIAAIVLQNLTAIVSLILIAVFHGVPENVDSKLMLWVNVGVVASFCALYPYLRALQNDESRNVVPLLELVPVILILLAYFVLGETMSWTQILFSGVLIACGFGFMWDFNTGRFKTGTLLLMLASSFLFAVYYLSLSHVGKQIDPIDLLWLVDSGCFGGAVVMAIVYPRALGNIKAALASSRGRILWLELLNGVFLRLGILAIIFAFAMAPSTGLVAAFSGVQPVFVFVLSGVTALILHEHYEKITWNRDTIAKIGCLILMILAAAGLHLVP